MTDFLLELRSEEIPARMQEKARADLASLFEARLRALNLEYGAVESYATPRRLALIVRDVADATQPMSEERKGPRADAPDQAIQGFLRSTGLTREQLVARDDGKGGQVLFAVIERPGLDAPAVLISACMNAIQSFGWPKSMRWGDASISTESLRWVRPLQGIVAMFGEKIVPFEAAGVKSGATTVGHRFHHPAAVTLGGASDYIEKLRACHVIVDGAERRGIIALGAKMAAAKAGLTLIEDDGLLYENAGLTEWPVPLLGRFDEDFLAVPPEVIQLTARVNQKYFVCAGKDGKLANAFVCTANIDAADGGAKIVEGNQKVLAARLSDARFFYETDLKTRLEDLQPKLEKIVFHEKLGTVADKVDRVAKLARWLVEEGIVTSSPSPLRGEGRGEGQPSSSASPAAQAPLPTLSPEGRGLLADQAERAARLAKADLVTGMVGEFPELQGLMGGYYAAAQGEDPAVAEAIRDHYKPVGQGDDVPTAPVTVAVSLADKIDTLVGFFGINQGPTGSKDPYALRRAGIGVLQLLIDNNLQIESDYLAARAFGGKYVDHFVGAGTWDHANTNVATDVMLFLVERLKVQQREAGVRHDLIDAVVSLGEPNLVRLLARVHALQAFIGTEDGRNLLAGYKRAANILKKEGWESADKISLSYTPEPEENALLQALDSAEPLAAQAIGREDFEGAMAALAGLRAPIDAFFDKVIVNDSDPAKREARLSMLARMRAAVHTVADFSKIEG
ncbi:glycine--tRNA ligase subunit beta [Sphingomonas sp. G-3-2-10]|uniref:glycine--tRNA ligase subunit beta n=1 Tax=Sphingomonas sp. G-3-2-10 TaxID=2728838 RepID=UPI00146E54C4|nr:glycine--tRNA ligase subunit beta [Sphingomonas sp. G-3-2-10]NML06072.1 glycine--tRNA ligase subunit beta [Sphingomonas sp. G-3-2-10]